MSATHSSETVTYRSLDFLGFPDCRVGDDGSVWSKTIARWLQRKEGWNYAIDGEWRRLSPCTHPKKGHQLVQVGRGKGRKAFWVHRLILTAFVGPCPEGMEGCHNDGNPANNRLDNLRWDTKEANEADRSRHGTDNRGSRHGMSKITEEQVLEMHRLYDSEGWRLCDIARRFGVSMGCAHSVVHRNTWKHLP